MRMIEPAAPYPDAGSAFPKYNPNANFPISNNTAVIIAPIHTDFHLIFTSGNILNIIANNVVVMANETKKLATTKIINKEEDKCTCIQLLNANNKEETNREISNKNAIVIINPNENNLL